MNLDFNGSRCHSTWPGWCAVKLDCYFVEYWHLIPSCIVSWFFEVLGFCSPHFPNNVLNDDINLFSMHHSFILSHICCHMYNTRLSVSSEFCPERLAPLGSQLRIQFARKPSTLWRWIHNTIAQILHPKPAIERLMCSSNYLPLMVWNSFT